MSERKTVRAWWRLVRRPRLADIHRRGFLDVGLPTLVVRSDCSSVRVVRAAVHTRTVMDLDVKNNNVSPEVLPRCPIVGSLSTSLSRYHLLLIHPSDWMHCRG